VITTDGTTLLGADNKAGIAVIMEAAKHLRAHPQIEHGPIRICFTCDEEVGHGVDHVDVKKLGAVVGYTLDGMGQGEIEGETFSADKATVTITGVNIHPSIAKGKMVNAIRLAGLFLDRLPRAALAPEVTEGREGFIHAYGIEGGVGQTVLRVLLRDFDTPKLAAQADLLRSLAKQLTTEYPAAKWATVWSADSAATPIAPSSRSTSTRSLRNSSPSSASNTSARSSTPNCSTACWPSTRSISSSTSPPCFRHAANSRRRRPTR